MSAVDVMFWCHNLSFTFIIHFMWRADTNTSAFAIFTGGVFTETLTSTSRADTNM